MFKYALEKKSHAGKRPEKIKFLVQEMLQKIVPAPTHPQPLPTTSKDKWFSPLALSTGSFMYVEPVILLPSFISHPHKTSSK